ncbi:MAG: Arylsulfatase precursor [candidate division BRC1 bacterium ADurb.BinA364]|nr:MAG: Arylsulfatase precursor [candidate division BRC1 bacterium ADurb.BinA364]
MRGYKQQVFEGGIRIPFYAQWKGVLPEGAVYEKPVISLDIAATAYALAGIESPSDKPLDGVNLIPFLVGEDKGMPHDCLFWRYRDQRAIRRGDWKLMTCNAEFWLLFNLADDLSEERDLSQQHPELARELLDEWNAWSAQMMEPRWNRKEPDLEWIESVGGLDPTRPPASNE